MNLTRKNLLNSIDRLLHRFGFVQRAIIDVESWDGAASNYSSTEEYCNACLINVNSSDDPDEWTQANCKLPVRREQDRSGDFVRQAVFAAAGGRGVSAVTKPGDVDQDTWDIAVRNAANELIGAYEQMDEVAPDGVFEAAGREPPERAEHDDEEDEGMDIIHELRVGVAETVFEAVGREPQRALSESRLYQKLYEQIYYNYDAWLENVFYDSGGMYAIAEGDGALWKFPFTTTEENLELGAPIQVTTLHAEVVPMRTTIRQQANGRYRWLSVSCTAVLNRDGEIDGTELFEAFERNTEEHGYPLRKFYHQGDNFRTGQADFIARRGFTLVTSGLYDESELARREIAARQADGEYWGESIGYRATGMEVLAVNGDTLIPVFTDGYITEISTLPEREAAALFTRTYQFMEVNRMALEKGSQQWNAFLKLFQDDEAAAEEWLAANPDEANREIQGNVDAGLTIARQVEGDKLPTLKETMSGDDLPTDEVDGVVKMRQQIEELSLAVNTLVESVEGIVSGMMQLGEDTDRRLGQLERTEESRRAAWLNDLPAVRSLQEIHYRPRQVTSESEQTVPDVGEQVEQLLAAKGLN